MDIKLLEEEIPNLGSGLPRSEGLHLTQITGDLAIQLGLFSDDRKLPIDKFELGFAFEECLENAWRDRLQRLSAFDIFRPGEQHLDGISGSPDGVSFRDGKVFLEEYKVTWYSMATKKFLVDMPTWRWQNMAYCKMMGMRDCIFRVFWVNGDYRPPSPAYQAYQVSYSQDEIDQNWEMIVNHAEGRGWL